jgi:hypothetical protein
MPYGDGLKDERPTRHRRASPPPADLPQADRTSNHALAWSNEIGMS